MNLKVPFTGASKRAAQRFSENTLDNLLPERANYLSDNNDIATDAPQITAPDEKSFRNLFGIGEKQTSIILTSERKGLMQRAEPMQGLLIDTIGQCICFSLVLGRTEMHAIIKKTPDAENLHLDALQIVHDGKPEDVPCGGAARVEKDYMDSLIQCFAAIAIRLQNAPSEQKSVLEHDFTLKIDRFLQLLPISVAVEARQRAISIGKQPRLQR